MLASEINTCPFNTHLYSLSLTLKGVVFWKVSNERHHFRGWTCFPAGQGCIPEKESHLPVLNSGSACPRLPQDKIGQLGPHLPPSPAAEVASLLALHACL